ncbi:SDR family NAD(P)-dependent oxidoreductase [bacterium]|nr:MAG: SDR family NAD(P)-dependent oxidoreductase [bacterium]
MPNPVKTCLVTGASSGIGFATALELQRAGYTVYGVARRVEKMEPLRAAGIHTLKMDLTNDADLERVVAVILAEQGTIDVLVNNAGSALPGAIEEVPIQQARDLLEVNLFGTARLTQLVLPHMRERGSGAILNVSSIGGEIALPLNAWYYASKHALEAFTDTLRQEVGQFGIRVVLIQPGIIKTEFEKDTAQSLRAVSGHGPYRRLANSVAAKAEKTFTSPKNPASDPSEVAAVIRKAIESPKPKTRYTVGYVAGTLLALNRLLSDRQFDNMVLNGLKKFE